MRTLLFIIVLLVSTICSSAQCKYTFFYDNVKVTADTVVCTGNPNHTLMVVMDCDSAQDYMSLFVLYRDNNIPMDRGLTDHKFMINQFGNYWIEEHRTWSLGALDVGKKRKFNVVRRRDCMVAE